MTPQDGNNVISFTQSIVSLAERKKRLLAPSSGHCGPEPCVIIPLSNRWSKLTELQRLNSKHPASISPIAPDAPSQSISPCPAKITSKQARRAAH